MSVELGEEAAKRIAPGAVQRLREVIGEVRGREVFFAGALNDQGLVERVRVCARGHEDAVPAFMESLDTGDVVLHNHPTGDLAPSDADLDLSSLFGFYGHGAYIVDNDVARVYVVVEPFLERSKHTLNFSELAGFIGPESRLSKLLPQFEVRPQQAEMMRSAAAAFNTNAIAVIEAPTGVGKTVAYLIPAILWAVRNRERVVISTRTINLQEQIVFKDLPLLERCLNEKFRAVLVKGRSNYLCRRRLQRALSEASLFEDRADQESLMAIDEWARKTQDGSLSDLPFVPKRDLWERVCSESDTCRFMQCPLQRECFFSKARREIAKADLLVVNHHMLFSDLAIKKELGNFSSLAVLPAYRRVVFDEAHSIEDSATEYFGVEATRNGAVNLLGRFIRSEKGHERGLLPYLKLKLMMEAAYAPRNSLDAIFKLIDNSLLPAIASAREALTTAFEAVRSLVSERCGQIGRDIKWRLTPAVLADPALRDIHLVYMLPAVEETLNCAKLTTGLARNLKELGAPPGERESPVLPEIMQLNAYRERLERLAGALAEGTSETLEPNTVRWVEIDAKDKRIVRIVRCPLEIGKPLAEWVYANLKTVVMTSATLTVGGRFDYLFSRIGLDQVTGRPIQATALDSPFDFQRQALLCIPTDIPEPTDGAYLDETVDHLREALSITKGHAFILFTSFYALDHAYKKLEAELKAAGIVPLRQGDASRTHLLERFRRDVSSTLFATDSFWEGVDVAGEALQCVIVPRLPFRVPTEPVLEARAEAIEAAGGNSFTQYTAPLAVIKFRQGFGRLIRRKTDWGAIVVLDRRIVTKHYGRTFLRSLPGLRVVKGPRQGVYLSLRKFFEQRSKGSP